MAQLPALLLGQLVEGLLVSQVDDPRGHPHMVVRRVVVVGVSLYRLD